MTTSVTEQNEQMVADLEVVLDELHARFGDLVSLAERRLEAIRAASPADLSACISAENEVVQRVAAIEKRRIATVGKLAERLGSKAGVNTSFTWIADRIDAGAGDRIRRLARRLRDRMEMLNRLNETAALATKTLVTHMQGLMAQVGARLSHARTYARNGAVLPGAAVVSSVDMTS